MRALVFFSLLACGFLAACGGPAQSQQAPQQWTTGFWFWQGSFAEREAASQTVDGLYVQVGSVSHVQQSPVPPGTKPQLDWEIYGGLPAGVPAAREYWMVFRNESQGLPDISVAKMIADRAIALREDARRRHLNVAGIQLDIDCPTALLADYAKFVRAVRKELPPDLQISVTALLDWFLHRTSIDDLVQAVDEFVPQFYDTASRDNFLRQVAIASKIDAAEWGPRLERFGKRYRIGISTFGRARFVPGGSGKSPSFYGDLKPLDVATSPAFQVSAARNAAGELVLSYKVQRRTRLAYQDLQPGDTIQFIVPTAEDVHASVEAARHMGPHCAGVLFFRWPSANETLTMSPDEALAAAGIGAAPHPAASIETISGDCAAVSCVDVYLVNAEYSSSPVRYRVRSSTELDYFLPESKLPAKMLGASSLELTIPPYCGRGKLFVGRAVTDAPAQFSVEKLP